MATLSFMPFNFGAAVFCTAVQTCYRDYSINFLVYLFIYVFIYLFIYKLRQEAWITHRATSTTRSRGKKKKKISNTTNKNDNTKKRQKEECQCKNRIWEDINKKSTTHTIKQAVQWLTSVALNTHTPKNVNVHHRQSYESY